MLSLYQMAKAYGQRPSTWLMLPHKLETPEGQSFAFDFDQAVFSIGVTFEAEQGELMRREAAYKARTKAHG